MLSTRKSRILVSAIAVLFRGVIKQATTAFKIEGIIFGTTGSFVGAEKGLGHGKFRHKGIGEGLAVRNGGTRHVECALFLRNILCGTRSPFI
jgi:hypothetical protein